MLYYGRRYNAASVGARVVGVVYEKCGCEYFYKLARVGEGAASAPYAIGSAGAERSANEQARKDLDQRLTEEAELVPCPKCWWINDEMVAGYRRGRYRGATNIAAGLGFMGTVASLAGAWFVSIGPAADRGALPYLLFGGPTVSIALAGAILLMRYLLRARIQPNLDYPLPPRLPHGSPAALVRNAATGELEPAGPVRTPGLGGGAEPWIEFQVGRDALPPICCGCLAPAAPGSEYRRPLGPAVEVVVPLCAPCARRWTGRIWLGALAGLGAITAIGLPVLLLMKLDEIIFWMAVVALGIVAPIVGSMVAGTMAEPVRVKVVDSSRGVARLWFRNEDVPQRVAVEGATRAG